MLRVIDVSGEQVGDLVCFNREDLMERYSPQNTILFNRTIHPKVGALLVSDRGRPMMRLVADTVGVHDLICGSCSEEYYNNRLGHAAPHRSCRQNLAETMAPWGVAPGDIPFSFNVFMRWPAEPDGTVVPMAAPSRAGDYADLQAEMDLVVANSACPSTSRRPTRTTRRRCGSSCTNARADRAPAGNPGGRAPWSRRSSSPRWRTRPTGAGRGAAPRVQEPDVPRRALPPRARTRTVRRVLRPHDGGRGRREMRMSHRPTAPAGYRIHHRSAP